MEKNLIPMRGIVISEYIVFDLDDIDEYYIKYTPETFPEEEMINKFYLSKASFTIVLLIIVYIICKKIHFKNKHKLVSENIEYPKKNELDDDNKL